MQSQIMTANKIFHVYKNSFSTGIDTGLVGL